MIGYRFSQRTNWDTTETDWARVLRERREAALPVIDLTASNPTRCGFTYDTEAILGALSNAPVLDYDPNPRGLPTARAAVARYYAGHRAEVDPERIFLTTSTSEAYSFLFKLLCDPGDEVLIAQPSYPLFDFLASLDDVRLVSYPLFYDFGWHIDMAALRERVTARTRAIVLVHPNNPTGHYTSTAERRLLEELCAERGLALIVDEVFLDYPIGDFAELRPSSFAAGAHPALTFVLSGLSKIAGLPQMKAAWVACFGPEGQLTQALDRLEVISDTFLSMNAPIQHAMPVWLAGREGLQRQIRARVRANLQTLDRFLDQERLANRLVVEAGWYAVLRIPAVGSDESTVLRLLNDYGVAIHSGDFFGFPVTGWLVASLLGDEVEFRRGISGIGLLLRGVL